MSVTLLITGLVTAFVVQVLKKVRGVPLHEGQKAKIRIVTGALSLIVAVGNGWADGSLGDDQVALLGEAVTNYLVATVSYFGFLRK